MRCLSAILTSLLAIVLLASPAVAQFPPERPTLVLDSGGHTAPIIQAVFTSDSKELITISMDRTIRFWEVATGRSRRVLRPPIGPGHQGELFAAALSPDGKVLAVAGYGFDQGDQKFDRRPSPIFLIDRGSGEIVKTLRGQSNEIHALAFSADGKHLASGDWNRRILFWDVDSGKVLKTLEGHAGAITSLAISPDGKKLVSTGGDAANPVGPERVAWLWSLETGKVLKKLEGTHTKAVRRVAWSPDGKRIATASAADPGDSFAALWDANGNSVGQVDYRVQDKPRAMECLSLAFSPDSSALLISLRDGFYASTSIYPLPGVNGAPRRFCEGNFHYEELASGAAVVSPDNQFVAVINDRHHRSVLYNRKSGTSLRTLGGIGRQQAVVAWVREDGHRTIAWRNRLPGQNYKPWERMEDDQFFDRTFRLDELDLVPVPTGKDDRFVRARFGEGPLGLMWAGGPKVTLERNKEKLADLLIPADSQWTTARAVTFLNPDRGVVTNSQGMWLFDTSPEGNGKRLHAFTGHNGPILSAAPSPDRGKYLLASAEDQILRVWDPNHTQPLLSLFMTPSSEWIAWTPEGYYAASTNSERLMGWHVNNGRDQMGTFHPASRFHARFYRPDVIRLVLAKGSVVAALKAADEARGKKDGAGKVADLSTSLPPVVSFTVKLDKGAATIEAKARTAADAEPVSSLLLLLDSRPAPLENALREFTTAKKKGDTVEAKWTLTLPAGNHSVAVLARGKETFVAADPIDVAGPAAAARAIHQLHLVSLGVSKYANAALNLSFADKDAQDVHGALEKACNNGGLYKPSSHFDLLTNEKATREALRKSLTALADDPQVKSGDLLVVSLSCHGDKDEKGNLWLLLHEADRDNLEKTCFSGEELKELLAKVPCKVLLLLDACHSGAVGALRKPSVHGELTMRLIDEDCRVTVITAAMGKEFALEGMKDEKGQLIDNGLFTRALKEALADQKLRDEEGRVYVQDLYQSVYRRVRRLSGEKQTPFYGPAWGERPFVVVKWDVGPADGKK